MFPSIFPFPYRLLPLPLCHSKLNIEWTRMKRSYKLIINTYNSSTTIIITFFLVVHSVQQTKLSRSQSKLRLEFLHYSTEINWKLKQPSQRWKALTSMAISELDFTFQDYRSCFSRDGSNFSSTPSSYNSTEFLAGPETPSTSNTSLDIPEHVRRAVHGSDSSGLARSFSPPGISIPVNIRRNKSSISSAPCSAHNSPGGSLGQASPKTRNRISISRSNSIPGIGSESSLYGK